MLSRVILFSNQLTGIYCFLVGSYPDHIKYTPDCGSVVVANQGKPGKDLLGKYLDPPGTVSVIHGEKTGNPSVQLVEFNAYNSRYGHVLKYFFKYRG